jgi:hypothetical protein
MIKMSPKVLGWKMDSERLYERLAISIASLDRSRVEEKIKNFKGTFKFDFTDEYLASLTLDRLKHILLAAVSTKLKRKFENSQI